MNIERLGQRPPPSSACGLLPVLGTVWIPRRAPTVKRGGRDPGVALPSPGDKEPALLPEIEPSFVNRIPLLLPACGWPQSRSQRRPG